MDSLWTEHLSEQNLSYGGLAIYASFPEGEILAKSGLPDDVTKDSYFRGASNTKTFTASAIMLLAERGELNINDYITDLIPGKSEPYIPDNQYYDIPFKQQIKIRQLLEHRAGVFDLTNYPIPDSCNAAYAGQNYIFYKESISPDHSFSIDEIINIIAINNLFDFAPDSDYHYSNTGYMLLGKIIERLSGQSFSDFISENLLIPNSLNHTTFPISSTSTLSDPYIAGKVFSEGEYYDCSIQNLSYEFAQGNIVTTLDDLLSWVKLWQTGQAGIPMSVVNQMRQGSGQNADYGFGTSFSEGIGYGHTGAIAGYLSFMFYDPDYDFSMVLVCNLWNMKDEISFWEQVYLLSVIFMNTKSICTGTENRTCTNFNNLLDLNIDFINNYRR